LRVFLTANADPGEFFYVLTTRGKPAVFNGQLAKPAIYSSTKSKIVNSCPYFPRFVSSYLLISICPGLPGIKRGGGTTPPPLK
jgi:hypothetical protein